MQPDSIELFMRNVNWEQLSPLLTKAIEIFVERDIYKQQQTVAIPYAGPNGFQNLSGPMAGHLGYELVSCYAPILFLRVA